MESTFDVAGFTQTTLGPDPRLTTTVRYDANGMPVELTQEADGVVITETTEYDANFRPIRITDAAGGLVQMSWSGEGHLTSTTDQDGVTTSWTVASTGEILATFLGGELQGTQEYDAAGHPLRSFGGDGTLLLEWAYNDWGMPVASEDGDGVRVEWELDTNGRVIAVFRGAERYELDLDAFGEALTVTDPLGNTEQILRDSRRQTVGYIGPTGQTRGFAYDERGLLVEELDSAGRPRTYTYDEAGRLISEVSRTGDQVSYTYDDAGQLVSVEGPDTWVRYTYDGFGRMTAVENDEQVVRFDYDATGDVAAASSEPQTFGSFPFVLFGLDYTLAGRLAGLMSSFGSTTYAFDGSGRLVELEDALAGTYRWGWSEDSQLEFLERPSGLVTHYDYTPGRRQAGQQTESAGSVVWSEALERDSVGRITSRDDPFGRHSFSYDAKGRLVSADHPTGSALLDELYAFDANGNRSEWGANDVGEVVYDDEERLTQDASYTYRYDGEGRLLERMDRGSFETTSYVWDSLDRLRRVEYADGTATVYRYDGLGRRIAVEHPGLTVRFGYDAGQEVRVLFDGDNNEQSWHTSGPDGALLAEVRSDGGARQALLSYLGTLTAWADAQGVTPIERDLFGNALGPPAGVEPAALSWHSQDPNGLVYARARYLDPLTGRFLSQDPVRSANSYVYAEGDPVNRWDPDGRATLAEETTLWQRAIPMTGALVVSTGGFRRFPSHWGSRTAPLLRPERWTSPGRHQTVNRSVGYAPFEASCSVRGACPNTAFYSGFGSTAPQACEAARYAVIHNPNIPKDSNCYVRHTHESCNGYKFCRQL